MPFCSLGWPGTTIERHLWNPRPFSRGLPLRDRSATQRQGMVLEEENLRGPLTSC